MLTIRVTAQNKKNLPAMMRVATRRRHRLGDLTGLVHIKDDKVWEVPHGWEMYSYWGTPEEVDMQEENVLIKEVNKYLYSSDDIITLVSIIWDILNKYNRSDVELFRDDVFGVLQGPDVIKSLLCVLIEWSDKIDIGG